MVHFPHLFTPLSLKGVSIRNRVVMAPMNTNFADSDGFVSEQFTRYLARLRAGPKRQDLTAWKFMGLTVT